MAKKVESMLLRFPNWLGDVVMGLQFLEAVTSRFPEATIGIIVPNHLAPLVALSPKAPRIHAITSDYKGLFGKIRFARDIKKKFSYDIYITLPYAFSAALMGFLSGAKERVGYDRDGRKFLLTKAYKQPQNIHRCDEYKNLLEMFLGEKVSFSPIRLEGESLPESVETILPEKYLVFNFNSEADSRRVPKEKAAAITDALIETLESSVCFVGSPKEREYSEEVCKLVKQRDKVSVLTGLTSIPQLVTVLNRATMTLSSDSGIAHLAGASGNPVAVLFGAGNPINTAPYNVEKLAIIADDLECSPCVENWCKFGVPTCLVDMKVEKIVEGCKSLIEE